MSSANYQLKKRLRSQIRSSLLNLGTDDISRQSLNVINNLKNLYKFEKGTNVSVYLSMAKEIQTDTLLKYFLELGVNVFVPKVIGKSSEEMIMTRLHSLEELHDNTIFKANNWGIKERILSSEENHESFDVVIVPGLAFTAECHRLGHGKGYYDSFLSKVASKRCSLELKPPLFIGIGLTCQLVIAIPVSKFDVQLDHVIFENKIFSKH